MPLFFVPMLGLMGIAIAMIRRSSQAPPNGLSEDLAARLLGWAVGLLSAERSDWGQAMLGELDHIDGRIRRLRFALGCVTTALLLPPWGRAAAAVWAMIVIAVGGVGLYASVAIRYRLGVGDWVATTILALVLAGFLLAASALLRRPGVAVPGLLGGLFVALALLTLSGFTFYDQIAPDIVPWHAWVITLAVPLVVGAAGTLWSGDPIVGKRVARLAAVTAGLGLYLYGTLAVAVLGAGGPPDDISRTVRFVVSDRLANNLVFLLLLIPMVTATVGWGGAAATAAATRMRPASEVTSAPFTAPGLAGWTRQAPTTTTHEQGRVVRGLDRRRTARLLALCAVAVSTVFLAAAGWLRG